MHSIGKTEILLQIKYTFLMKVYVIVYAVVTIFILIKDESSIGSISMMLF